MCTTTMCVPIHNVQFSKVVCNCDFQKAVGLILAAHEHLLESTLERPMSRFHSRSIDQNLWGRVRLSVFCFFRSSSQVIVMYGYGVKTFGKRQFKQVSWHLKLVVLVSCQPSSNDFKLSNILHLNKAQFVLIFLSAFSYYKVLCPSFNSDFSEGNLPKVKPTSQFMFKLPVDQRLNVLLFSCLILLQMEPSLTVKHLQVFLTTVSNGSFWLASVWNTRACRASCFHGQVLHTAWLRSSPRSWEP